MDPKGSYATEVMALSCDEWFHTLCVNMPDLEIDLVDQFICPPCIQSRCRQYCMLSVIS